MNRLKAFTLGTIAVIVIGAAGCSASNDGCEFVGKGKEELHLSPLYTGNSYVLMPVFSHEYTYICNGEFKTVRK